MRKEDLLSCELLEITNDEANDTNGGNPVIWTLIGALVGGISDFKAGYAAAQK